MFLVILMMVLIIIIVVILEMVYYYGVMFIVIIVVEIIVIFVDLVCMLYIYNVDFVFCLIVSCVNYVQFLVFFIGYCFDKYFDCKELFINGIVVCEYDIDIKYGCWKFCGFCDGKLDKLGEI